MPVPTIYIRHVIDIEGEKSVREIVDGQQRIRSILEFKAGEFRARHPAHRRPVHYSELSNAQKLAFASAKLPVAYLVGADDSDVIEIFGRLNAVSKTLNPQEKRSARFSPRAPPYCLRESANRLPLWRTLGVFSATEISRMQEVQFVAELSMALHGGATDFSSARIDRAYEAWDEEFPGRDDIQKRMGDALDLIASSRPEAIRDTIFRSRGPLFYSLVVALDQASHLPTASALEDALFAIDSRFNDDRPTAERPPEDVAFVDACKASTQRIRSRADPARLHSEVPLARRGKPEHCDPCGGVRCGLGAECVRRQGARQP